MHIYTLHKTAKSVKLDHILQRKCPLICKIWPGFTKIFKSFVRCINVHREVLFFEAAVKVAYCCFEAISRSDKTSVIDFTMRQNTSERPRWVWWWGQMTHKADSSDPSSPSLPPPLPLWVQQGGWQDLCFGKMAPLHFPHPFPESDWENSGKRVGGHRQRWRKKEGTRGDRKQETTVQKVSYFLKKAGW